MQTPLTEPPALGAREDDEEDTGGGGDAPPAPDEEPDGEPDPAFD